MEGQAAAAYQSAKQLGEQFAKVYYEWLSSGTVENLATLFLDQSFIQCESEVKIGKSELQSILDKRRAQYITTTVDAHPLPHNLILVHVVGQCKKDQDPPHGFSESIVLMQMNESYVITNSIFRLSLHHG